MSGTSADGIDVAIARVLGRRFDLRFELLAHQHFAYPRAVRETILKTMNATRVGVAELSRLNFLLGELYAEAIRKTQHAGKFKLELIGCHGQTIYHQGDPALYLGKKISCTWQTGEGAIIAARLKVPVVSDFRPADMAAGGKGAPLVPFLDYAVFRSRHVGRIAQNIGGIANLTAIAPNAKPEDVVAFDTGPGNMVIDQLMQLLFGQPYDRNGEVARRGRILQPILEESLKLPFLRRKPPKTAGREEFGAAYARNFLRRCRKASREDVIATATALTVHSISDALKRFVSPQGDFRDYIVSGGGARNRTLMRMLEAEASKLGLRLGHSDDFGIPSQAKESLAFALLAYQTWNRQPANIPSATGATRPAVLGKISYV
ncbi:MAG TPA: anhydro-N-acetylmuramic acid kinase [Candidatus Solibacter sp.]|jgi:anhydro-N-acetylmuramic acid kinase|nr:anhydro-N-acetylmuramic acid kinase [Candidatus Solibacter sp.]